MKVSLITSVFPHPQGGKFVGIERYSWELAGELSKRGAEVLVVTTLWNGGEEAEDHDGISIRRVSDSSMRYGRLGRLFDWHYRSWGEGVLKLGEELKGVDVVHTVSPLSCAERLRRMGLPIVMTVHHYVDSSSFASLLYLPFHHGLERHTCSHSNIIIAPSSGTAKEYAGTMSVPMEKFRIIPHGVDLERFRPSSIDGASDTVNLLYVGGYEPRKGLIHLMRALRIVEKKERNFRLTCVGPGAGAIEALARGQGLAQFVEAVGYVSDDEELVEMYRRCDVFVLPSLKEGFGMVLAEAMACGKPVVASYAAEEVVGGAGILVPPADEVGLARSILRLIEAPDERRRLGSLGRQRVLENFSWKKTAELTLKAYSEAMASAGR